MVDPTTVEVTVIDDELEWILLPKMVNGGSSISTDVRLPWELLSPTDNVTFTITGYGGTNLGLSSGSELKFLKNFCSTVRELTLDACSDTDCMDENVTLRFTASGGCYDGLKHIMYVTIRDDHEDVVLIPEGDTREIRFELHGRNPSTDPVIIFTQCNTGLLEIAQNSLTAKPDSDDARVGQRIPPVGADDALCRWSGTRLRICAGRHRSECARLSSRY